MKRDVEISDPEELDVSEMKPKLAITMGDPAGIGPEIVCKALMRKEVFEFCHPVVYGDRDWMNQTAESLKSPLEFVSESEVKPNQIQLIQATTADLSGIRIGEVSAEAGRAGVESVIFAAKSAMSGEADAIVTAPLNKESIRMAGYSFPGHTEALAEVTGTRNYGMLLLSGALRVVHVSTHVSLREAITRTKTARILECIRLGESACRMLGIESPRIAVAGLNPHAGEGGLFGTEEIEEIEPAVRLAQSERILATGPHPPDTIFARAAKGEFDLVVAMYHDQGHIPVKLHGFDTGVNVTIGLPILRVSVDHGTAFDIAGKGVASEASLLEAVRVATMLARNRESFRTD